MHKLTTNVINRAVCAIAFTTTLFATTSPDAIGPFRRSQLEGIANYQTLELNIRADRVTGEDVLEAAGLEENESEARFVQGILRDDLLKAFCATVMSADVDPYRAWHCHFDVI